VSDLQTDGNDINWDELIEEIFGSGDSPPAAESEQEGEGGAEQDPEVEGSEQEPEVEGTEASESEPEDAGDPGDGDAEPEDAGDPGDGDAEPEDAGDPGDGDAEPEAKPSGMDKALQKLQQRTSATENKLNDIHSQLEKLTEALSKAPATPPEPEPDPEPEINEDADPIEVVRSQAEQIEALKAKIAEIDESRKQQERAESVRQFFEQEQESHGFDTRPLWKKAMTEAKEEDGDAGVALYIYKRRMDGGVGRGGQSRTELGLKS